MKNNTDQIHISVLSQAPFDGFGDMLGTGAYEGDGKDLEFTPDRNASARLEFVADISLDRKQVDFFDCDSPGGTQNLKTLEEGKADTKEHATLSPNNTLNFDYSGSNPIPPFDLGEVVNKAITPEINVKGNLQFTNEDNGNLHIQGKLYGDGFPSTSAFIHFTEANENGVMLGSHAIAAGTDKDTGVTELFGGANVEIMHVELSIGLDENHIPISVTNLETNQTYSVKEWNDIHKEKPMITPEALTHIETCVQNVDNHVTTPSVEECLTDTGEIDTPEIELVGIAFDKNGIVGSDENTTSNEVIKENQDTQEKTNTQDYNISPTVDTYLNDMSEHMANVDDNSSGRTLADDYASMGDD